MYRGIRRLRFVFSRLWDIPPEVNAPPLRLPIGIAPGDEDRKPAAVHITAHRNTIPMKLPDCMRAGGLSIQ